MTSGQLSDPPAPSYYHPLQPDQHQDYVVLPVYIPAVIHRRRRKHFLCAATLLLLAVAVYLLWPSDPELSIVRLHLDRVQVHAHPLISLDISLGLTVKVRNRDFYSIDYRSLLVSIGYRGKQLGFVNSNQGHLRARGSSYIDATLVLDGVEILSDVILLLEDLARGSVPFDTVTEIHGQLGLLFFEIPLQAKVSCEVNVNTRNQTIVRQNCYPE